MKTYIVGHKNPDTDSIISAIALAWAHQKMGEEVGARIPGEPNKETEYVLNKFGFQLPEMIGEEEKQVYLVDHNEPSQIHENIKNEEVKAVFDHHKLGGLTTPKPIFIKMLPYGSTSTIVAKLIQENKIELEENIAGILLAGIISDTLKLTSPTTTTVDKEMIEFLNDVAGLDIDGLATEMFAAKSDITGITVDELISADYKEFDMKGKRVGIGVWETVLPDVVLEKKAEILKALESKKAASNLDFIYFAVVDIVNNLSHMFSVSEVESNIVNKAYKVETKENIAILPGVVSRKSQIAPVIEDNL